MIILQVLFLNEMSGQYLTSWNMTDKPITAQTEVDSEKKHVYLIADQTVSLEFDPHSSYCRFDII